MSVMVIVEIPGLELSIYDAVMKELGLSKRGAKWPKGAESHHAGKTPAGLFVVDVWKSEADFAKFRDSKLGAALAKAGVNTQPKITIVPVHFGWSK